VAKLEIFQHCRAAEIEVTVTKPDLFLKVFLVLDREGRGQAGIDDLETIGEELDLPGRELRVDGALGPRPNLTLDRNHKLRAKILSRLVSIGRSLRTEDHLGQTGPVTKIDEDHPAVVAAAANPTAKGDPGRTVR
jgi:hypothetical protein